MSEVSFNEPTWTWKFNDGKRRKEKDFNSTSSDETKLFPISALFFLQPSSPQLFQCVVQPLNVSVCCMVHSRRIMCVIRRFASRPITSDATARRSLIIIIID